MAKGKKTGGREKGTPNKLTKELRATLKNALDGELEKLPEHLEKLEPKERVELLIKLMPYVVPKVESVNHSHDEPFEISWDF
ncbi:MAG: hypothetical protein ABEH43_05430 [Flavobacteriales bacterium]